MNASAVGGMPRQVPLLSATQAAGCLAFDNFRADHGFKTVGITVERKRHTFAVLVQGDSMTSSEGHSFPAGSVLVIEPEMAPMPGDYVLASAAHGDLVFKQLMHGAEGLLLKPLNPRYPTRPLGAHRLIGVVRETTRQFR